MVGGGPAGLEAARAFRDAGGTGEVLVLSSDTAAPYERPALSKEFLRGIRAADDIALESGDFYRDQRITVRLETAVASLDARARVLRLGDGAPVAYESCVPAMGAHPRRLPVPGGDDPRVLTLRSLDDSVRLVATAERSSRATVVGSGFIACEAAASLALRGLQVTMITDEEAPQIKRLGRELGAKITSWLEALGVTMITSARIARLEDGVRVHLLGQDPVDADMILSAVGVEPRGGLGEQAGLEMEQGRFVVDQHMRASVPGVLAAGDVAYAMNAAAGRRLVVEHWGEALEMGRIAGAVAAGGSEQWAQAPGFWSTIGEQTIKYAAWGDGFDEVLLDEGSDGFTAWYGMKGVTVGVLTRDRDEDYERGQRMVEQGEPLPRR